MKNNLQDKSGIYKITINDYYIYIGQSMDIERRWYTHLNKLKRNRHQNTKFQNVFNKYPNTIKFEIIEECDVDKLDNKEMFYIEYFNTYKSDRGLNMSIGGDSNRKYKTKEEAEAAALEKYKQHREIYKDKIKQYHKEYRKTHKDVLKQRYVDNREHLKQYHKQWYQKSKKQKGILSRSERRKLQFETRYNLSRPLTNKEWDTWRNTKNKFKRYVIKFLKTLPDLTFIISSKQ